MLFFSPVDRVKNSRRRALRKRRKLRKPPKWLPPDSAMREYYKALLSYVDLIIESIDAILMPELSRLIDEANKMKPDSAKADSWADDIDTFMEQIQIRIEQNPRFEAATLALNIGQKVSQWNSDQWQKILRAVLGVDVFVSEPWLSAELDSFVRENVQLISSIRTQSLTNLQGMIQRSIRSGMRHEKLAGEIKKEYGVMKRRAALIARDQTNKLNGNLMEYRQKGLGVKKYRWRTSLDERVRGNPTGLYPKAIPSHWDREGKTFDWNEPPEGGHPGWAILCRCTAEPILDEVFQETQP